MTRRACCLTFAITTVIALALAACGSSSRAASNGARASTTAGHANATTPPSRNGPYAVGRRVERFVDTSRSTPANGRVPAKPSRMLETIVEYPTAGALDANHDTNNAPAMPGRFPLLVFAHGFSAHADNPYLHPWAAAGFVAVSPTFPLTNTDAVGEPNRDDVLNEPADVSFVISQMAHLPESQADLQAVVDASSVGIMGQSLGAAIALSVGFNKQYKDPRIKAVASAAGSCPAAACPFNATPVPLMVIHGTADPFAPYQGAVDDYARATRPKFFVTLVGAKHVQFGQPWDAIAEQATIDFFRRYVANRTDSLTQLNADVNSPSKARLQEAP